MNLIRADLWSLEEYSEKRNAFRSEVIAHKKNRQVRLGGHMTLIFEDSLTIKYQIQEMLRIEKIFEPAGIQEELDAYNPLIPEGDNWKCTLMIQYEDIEERRQRLKDLVGVEDTIWIQVDELPKVYPVADEDLDRSDEEKTSAVHFLRYQLSDDLIRALKSGGRVTMGVDHPAYPIDATDIDTEVAASILKDLD